MTQKGPKKIGLVTIQKRKTYLLNFRAGGNVVKLKTRKKNHVTGARKDFYYSYHDYYLYEKGEPVK